MPCAFLANQSNQPILELLSSHLVIHGVGAQRLPLAWLLLQVIIGENVPNFLTKVRLEGLIDDAALPAKDRTGNGVQLLHELRAGGYSARFFIVNACDFGLPEYRRRLNTQPHV